jgi:hypothetical protein
MVCQYIFQKSGKSYVPMIMEGNEAHSFIVQFSINKNKFFLPQAAFSRLI